MSETRLVFLDTRKAFDRVGHNAIWTACRRLGVPEHYRSKNGNRIQRLPSQDSKKISIQ